MLIAFAGHSNGAIFTFVTNIKNQLKKLSKATSTNHNSKTLKHHCTKIRPDTQKKHTNRNTAIVPRSPLCCRDNDEATVIRWLGHGRRGSLALLVTARCHVCCGANKIKRNETTRGPLLPFRGCDDVMAGRRCRAGRRPPNSPRGLRRPDTIISIDDLLRFCDDLMLIYARLVCLMVMARHRWVLPFYGLARFVEGFGCGLYGDELKSIVAFWFFNVF